jgi:hypothetical protein
VSGMAVRDSARWCSHTQVPKRELHLAASMILRSLGQLSLAESGFERTVAALRRLVVAVLERPKPIRTWSGRRFRAESRTSTWGRAEMRAGRADLHLAEMPRASGSHGFSVLSGPVAITLSVRAASESARPDWPFGAGCGGNYQP